MSQMDKGKKDQKQSIINLTLAAVAGQVGCLTLIILLGAVFLGLWLDSHFNSKPTFTIIAVLISIPISLAVMFLVARSAIARIKTESSLPKPIHREGTDLGKNT
jgi:F0F1-type ATP synthase assembly protein I